MKFLRKYTQNIQKSRIKNLIRSHFCSFHLQDLKLYTLKGIALNFWKLLTTHVRKCLQIWFLPVNFNFKPWFLLNTYTFFNFKFPFEPLLCVGQRGRQFQKYPPWGKVAGRRWSLIDCLRNLEYISLKHTLYKCVQIKHHNQVIFIYFLFLYVCACKP